MDINNIAARSMVHGDQWYNPVDGTPKCEFPKGSGKNIATAGSLWIGGYDLFGNLRVSAPTYRQSANRVDYWPGPFNPTLGPLGRNVEGRRWNKIWTVSRSAIDSFLSYSTHTVANTPAGILDWPANGNPYAKDSAGAPLIINGQLAPFVDVNQNGTYDPLTGDFPAIKGDKMMWWIFNDGNVNHDTGPAGLGVEVAQSVYGFKRQSGIDNVLFYEYLIKNISTASFDSTRLALWADIDLGWAMDDMLGYDVSRRMAFAYNGTAMDNIYGTAVPAVGITYLRLPGDSGSYRVPGGGYTTYNNDSGPNGNPVNAAEKYALLHNHSRSGQPMYPIAGNVVYDLTNTDPCTAVPGDRRLVTSSGTFRFPAGTAVKMAFALVACPNAGGCPNFSYSSSCLPALADSARSYYEQADAALAVGSSPELKAGLTLTPNPARDMITLRSAAFRQGDAITVYDLTGRKMQASVSGEGEERFIRVGDFAAGIYLVRCTPGGETRTIRFVKE
jgi:hypothetical protein